MTRDPAADRLALAGDLDRAQAVLFVDHVISTAPDRLVAGRMWWLRSFLIRSKPSRRRSEMIGLSKKPAEEKKPAESGGPAQPEKAPERKVGAEVGGGTALERARPGVPDYLAEAVREDAGKGVSTDSADNIVPLVYVMHKLSPQVDEANPAYVPGARPGSIWLRNFDTPMVPGDQGILVQPCAFWKDWPEWVPRERGGGFVARHPCRMATAADVARHTTRDPRLGALLAEGEDVPDVEDATFVVDPKNRQKKWSRPNGNDLILTRNHAVRVMVAEGVGVPYVIPMKGASHSVSKSWMGKFGLKRAGDKLLPSFAALYRLTTRHKKNTQGEWHQFEVADAGYVSRDDYLEGRALWQAFESGAKVAEAEVSGAGDDGAAGDGGGGDAGATGKDLPY